ncbi:hypothetical protein [Bacteroides xylanisolvens]|uniref:hypothetical protein n=1 Tax=Bacteroides xylanisolvens TaxID=371601 RepID=UPI0039B6E2FF
MKKNFVRVMLFGALTLTVSTVVTSCKDYDDDIKGLQEQVDKITSTSPVSTEDMKNAVEKAKQDLQTQLNDLSALVENPDGEKTLKEKIAALEQALADATGDKAKDLATRLADLQNQLTTLQKILKGEDGVSGLEKKIEELENVKTVLSELIAAEQAYITSGKKDASAYESTSFGAYVNQAIINALQHEGDDTSKWGKIAQYVTEAVQKGISTELSGINNYLTAQYGVKTTLETFVKDVYEKLFSEEAIGKQTQLDNLLDAINAYVSTEEGADYKSYADIIKQIDDTKKQLAALELPATGTFSQAVKDIIKSESEQVGGVIKNLESRLDAEIKAIKGMIQSIVYIPESADRTVNFNTFYVKYSTNGNADDWSPVLNANEVKVNFRVSPHSAVAELIKGEEGKYLIAADYHQLTRATGTHFAIKKIEAVTGEPNVIAVTLDASTADKSYAVALTVKDKGETTLNDITSDYFAAVKENMYIEEVEWVSVNAAASEVAKNASIDYKATGSYYKMTVHSILNNNGSGDVDGEPSTKTKPEEFGISVDNLFSVTFGTTGGGASSFTMNETTGVLTGNAGGMLGNQCQATSTVKAKAPAGVLTGDKSFTQKTYETVTLIDIQKPTTIELADPSAPLVWHKTTQELPLNSEKVDEIKTALNISDFNGCDFKRIAPADVAPVSNTLVATPDIKFNNNSGDLVLEVPAGATYTGTVTTKITNTTGHISIVLSTDVDIKYPAEADLTLVNSNAWDGAKAILNLVEAGDPITAVTAERDLTELFTNYADFVGSGSDGTFTSLGGKIVFSVVGEVPNGVTLNSTTGALSVAKTYPVGGAGFSVKVEAKCEEKVISTKTIPVVFNTAKMNGTFDYSTEGENNDKLAFDVSSAVTRGEGVEVSKALVWKDASDRQLWPSTEASTDYDSSKGAEIFGFTVSFELVAGEDNSSFELNPTTGKLTLTKPGNTQGTKAMTVKVKAIPTSPWGTVEPRVVTVTVAEWGD